MLSYDSSPAFTVDGQDGTTTSGAARHLLPPGRVRRRAGRCRQPATGAEALVDFLLSREVQAALPDACTSSRSPPTVDAAHGLGRVRGAARPTPYAVDPAEIAAQPRGVADASGATHHPVTDSTRCSRLAGLALVPLLVLGVFFVLPVGGMVGRGLWPTAASTRRGARGAGPAAGAPGAVVHALVGQLGDGVSACCSGCPRRTSCTGWRSRCAASSARLLLVPFVLPTVVVGVAFRQLLGEGGPLGFLDLDGTPVAIIAGLVFFNVAVVIRAVGAAWESLDPRPGEAAAALGATPAPGVPHRDAAGAAAGDRVGRERGLPVLRDGVRRRAHPRRRCATPRSRPRSTCSPPQLLRPPAPPPRCRSLQLVVGHRHCSWSPAGCAPYPTRRSQRRCRPPAPAAPRRPPPAGR